VSKSLEYLAKRLPYIGHHLARIKVPIDSAEQSSGNALSVEEEAS